MGRGEIIGVKDRETLPVRALHATIPELGEPKVDSPIKNSPLFTRNGELVEKSFVQDAEKVLVYDTREYLMQLAAGTEPLSFSNWSAPGPRFFLIPPRCTAPSPPAGVCAPAPMTSSGPLSWNSITFTMCATSTGCATASRASFPATATTSCASPPTRWRIFTTTAAPSCLPPGVARTSAKSLMPWSA